jgi:thiol-disulfide isomerase/thioredoxin
MFFSSFANCHCAVRCFASLCFALVAATSCFAQQGVWDASLESPGGPIRFKLKIEKGNQGRWSADIINGQEAIDIPKVELDSDGGLLLDMDHYDSKILLDALGSDPKKLTGAWKKRRGVNKWVEMKFHADPAQPLAEDKLNSSFDGRWQVNFSSSEDPAVGVFRMDPKTKMVLGTFMTTTGDYRYLAGSANETEMELSCFDGAHAFLFKAKLQEDGSLSGDFWSSKNWHETWTATRNDDAKLPDGFELTKATSNSVNSLTFPDLEGVDTGLDDEKFAAPVRIVHVFGSWCPNCHDAGTYLATLKEKYEEKISVVGIAFELTGDFKRDAEQVRIYLKRHGLDHAVLIGGKSSKSEASEVMSVIDQVRSYPTTVFADSEGKIVAVHQGFAGPATGDAYEKLKKKFTSVIDGILAKASRAK